MRSAKMHRKHSCAHAKVDTWETDTLVQVSVFCNVSVAVMTVCSATLLCPRSSSFSANTSLNSSSNEFSCSICFPVSSSLIVTWACGLWPFNDGLWRSSSTRIRSGQASSSSWQSLPRLITSLLCWGCVLMLTSSSGHGSACENTRRTGRCTTWFGESVAMETTPRLRSMTAPTLVRSAPRRTGYVKSSIIMNSWENPPGETFKRAVRVHVRSWLFVAYKEGAVSATLIAVPAHSTTDGETRDTSAPVSETQSPPSMMSTLSAPGITPLFQEL